MEQTVTANHLVQGLIPECVVEAYENKCFVVAIVSTRYPQIGVIPVHRTVRVRKGITWEGRPMNSNCMRGWSMRDETSDGIVETVSSSGIHRAADGLPGGPVEGLRDSVLTVVIRLGTSRNHAIERGVRSGCTRLARHPRQPTRKRENVVQLRTKILWISPVRSFYQTAAGFSKVDPGRAEDAAVSFDALHQRIQKRGGGTMTTSTCIREREGPTSI